MCNLHLDGFYANYYCFCYPQPQMVKCLQTCHKHVLVPVVLVKTNCACGWMVQVNMHCNIGPIVSINPHMSVLKVCSYNHNCGYCVK